MTFLNANCAIVVKRVALRKMGAPPENYAKSNRWCGIKHYKQNEKEGLARRNERKQKKTTEKVITTIIKCGKI